MAEIVGLALSAATLINNCLDIFNKIQSARHFAGDYQGKLIKLAVAGARLAKWGQAMGISYEEPHLTVAPIVESAKVSEVIKVLLKHIKLLFEEAEKASRRYNLRSSSEDPVPVIAQKTRYGFHNRPGLLGNIRQSMKWALMDEKSFGKRIEDISSFIDDLVMLCPIDTASRISVAAELGSARSEPTPPASNAASVGGSYGDPLESKRDQLKTACKFQSSQRVSQSDNNGRGWASFSSAPPGLGMDHDDSLKPDLGPRRLSEPPLSISFPSGPVSGVLDRSGVVSGAVAVALDQKRLAYLVKFSVHLLDVHPEFEIESSVCRRISKTISLPTVSGGEWEGIAIAGNYLAAWGRYGTTSKSLLHVVFLPVDSTGQLSPLDVDLPNSDRDQITNFSRHRRVAISSLGLVALINHSDIYIIVVENGLRADSQRIGVRRDFEVIDAVFNETGDVLFAWAMGKKEGALFSWRVSCKDDPIPKSEGYYECMTNEDVSETKLFPYNTRQGCIIGASGGTKFFPAVMKHPPAPQILKRNISKALERSEVVAARMFNDRSFITVERGRNWPPAPYCIREYPVQYGGGKVHSIEAGREIRRLARKPSKGSQVGVFWEENALLLLVCHLDGWIEAVKLENPSLMG